MKSQWSDDAARAATDRWVQQGWNEDVALRVYTTRLLGGDPRLVLHGGGNTSVKTRVDDITGESVDVLCVKGSGWDMAVIEPPGLPAVKLDPLKRLIELPALPDEEMVALQRRNLLDPGSPNPSVETLLHAFLPHKFIDHTHANAVLALTDQANGEELAREVYGDRVAIVPYVMPGFDMAKQASAIFAETPDVDGLVLLKHGIFSFGPDARHAYELMIELVSLAEARLAKGERHSVRVGALPANIAAAAEVAPILRGLLARPVDPREGLWKRFVLEHRTTDAIRDYTDGLDLDRYSQAGTITPDHVIRTKAWPLLLPTPEAGRLDEFAAQAKAGFAAFEAKCADYFERNNRRFGGAKTELDRAPRVILIPGLGAFVAGESAKAAAIAGDLTEAAAEVIPTAEAIGRFESIPEADLFDVEYWSLEQAKLGKGAEKPFARHVVAITGGAGGIGRATAAAFKAQGAEVALLDIDPAEAARALGAFGVACDVTDAAAVQSAFDAVCARFGGVDILVSNAGAAWQGRMGDVSDADLRASFELNFFAHQHVAKAAVAVMLKQGTGGMLLFNASKQALNPGPNFGPYGLPKAATLALMRQYALDYGADGITANAVNADRIRSGLLTDEMIASRSKARGLSETDYMSGNLLGREVTAKDVGEAFVSLALARKTTGAVLTVDGGNIAAAVR